MTNKGFSEFSRRSLNVREKFVDVVCELFPGVIIVVEWATRRVVHVTGRSSDLIGVSPEKFLQTDFFSVIPEAQHGHIEQEVGRLQHDARHVSFMHQFKHREGTTRTMSTAASLLTHEKGKMLEVLLVCHEISESQKKPIEDNNVNDELLRESEELLAYGTWKWSLLTDELQWSAGMYRMLGYNPNDPFRVTNAFYLEHVSNDDKERLLHAVAECLKNNAEFQHTYVLKARDSTHKVVFTKGKVITDGQGRAEQMIGITRDITSIAYLQAESERTIRELNRSNKELEEFAYIASHDLQEPLRKISIFNGRIRLKYASAIGNEGIANVDKVEAAAENMRTFIDNLLKFSVISRNSRDFTSCDLNQIISEVVSDYDLKIEESGTLLSIARLPIIDGEPVQLKQLFVNLLSNAMKLK